MASKLVTDREKSARSVVAVGETQASVVEQALKTVLEPYLKKGEALPDVAFFMRLITRALDAVKTRMVDADAAHDAELSDDEPIRKARDKATEVLSDKLVELREVITGMYGAATASAIFPGPTPQDPVVLSRFAGDVAAALKRVKLPASRVKGAKIDAAETADDIKELRTKLDGHLNDVARELREAQATLDTKNQAIAGYDESFAGWATTLTGLLRAAGKAELAAKVRPSSRRPGQTASDAGDESAAPTPPEK